MNDQLNISKSVIGVNGNKSILKWEKERDFRNDPIILAITEEMIQEEAESEIDRRLTQKELYRVYKEFYEGEETEWNRMVLVREAICEAINNKDYQWSSIDKDFDELLKDKKLPTIKSIEISIENLKGILNDFGHDLTNFVVNVKNGNPILPQKGSKKLVSDYVKTIFKNNTEKNLLITK